MIPAPDVWVYWDYRLAGTTDVAREHDTLLVVFRAGAVAELRLVRGAAVRALLARMKH